MIRLLIILALLCNCNCFAQDWTLKLSSNVELKSWTLTNKAEKKQKHLQGATISLYKWSTLLSQTTSDANGDFTIDVPARGDFVLNVAFDGCNTKKFYVSTNGVPENVGNDNYKPTITIGGFVISKPISGVDYIGLNNPLVKVEYKTGGQNFDKDDKVTTQGLQIISKIAVSENFVIEKFCAANKLGDEALAKKKCQIAIDYYKKAIALIPDEKYPKERLEIAEECLKNRKDKEESAAEEQAEKTAAGKIAVDAAIKEKQVKNNATFKKGTTTSSTVSKEVKTPKDKTNTTKPEPAKNNGLVNKNNNVNKQGNTSAGKGNRKMPHLLATDQHKEAIDKADILFKEKRYGEAKIAYSQALKIKPADTYSAEKIKECDNLSPSKSEKHS